MQAKLEKEIIKKIEEAKIKKEIAIIIIVFSATISLVLGLFVGGIVNRPTQNRHKTEINKISDHYQQRINEMTRQIQACSVEISTLKTQNSLYQKELKGKVDENENLKQELISIKKDFDSQSAELNNLKKQQDNSSVESNPIKDGACSDQKTEPTNNSPKTINSEQAEMTKDIKYPYGSPNTVVSESFFDIRLGGYLELYRLNGKEIPLQDKDDPTRLLGINSSNSAIKDMYVRVKEEEIHKGKRGYKIYSLFVYFEDTSRANFDAIKSGLEKKYGIENKADAFDLIEEKAKYYVCIDGVVVSITLQRRDNIGSKNEFWISYRHLPLIEEINETIKDGKARKVKSDL